MIGVKLNNADTIQRKLRRFFSPALKKRVSIAAGTAARETMRAHFYKLHNERTRNVTGSGFYAEAADLSFYDIRSDGTLWAGTTKKGVTQRYYGGTITAGKSSKLLTIPVHPQAYGRRARSFDDLVLIRSGTPGMLVLGKAGKNSFFTAFYILVPQVYQKPDKSVAPEQSLLTGKVLAAIDMAYRTNK